MNRWIFLTTMVAAAAACTPRTGEAPSEAVEKMTKSEGETQPAKDEANTPRSEAAKAYEAECDALLKTTKEQIAALEALEGEKTVDSVLEPLNEIWIGLDRGANTASLMREVHPDASFREVADRCEQEFEKLVTALGLSRPLFDAVSALDVSQEDEVTRRLVDHLLRDFRRSGVDKDEATRKKVTALQEELVTIGQAFGKNIREDVQKIELDSVERLAGLPQDYIDAHAPNEAGKIIITTDYPDYIPFLTYAKDDAARLELYRVFKQRGHPQNLEVLGQLLKKRHELATLLGYESWAAYVTEDKMIKSNAAARDFIEKIAKASKARADRDYAELLARLQKELPEAKEVGDWQKGYLEELLKKEKYAFDSQKVREYFTYAKVRDGIFAMTGRLFGVEIRKVEAETWHESVEAYELLDGGQVIGRFFLDMHPREDKYKHAAAFPMVTGIVDRQEPMATLVCNFPAEGPMEHDQVQTFFHEFGHLIHHLFGGDHRWVEVSGFRTEWDFVEAPSQILEEWAWDASTLKTFATNAKGEPIPDELVKAMRRARDFGKGTFTAHQMFYASVSLNFYEADPATIDTTALLKELQARYSPFAYVEDTYFQTSFGHLYGYSAIYYTYMWSLVISKDLFSVFQKEGITNPEVAARYRKLVLAPGGSKDAAVMVRDFLGRDYGFEAYEAWLNAGD
ncbi:MAG: Zn-dependent oligopeptidase [Deltaproteobacteria bacterium]|nr:Zn-dependent oligopeptidase [Deltaproteobacteria bacterium]